MNILILGGGGREHALAWRAARCAGVTQVFVAPGNAGTARTERVTNVAIGAEDLDGPLQHERRPGHCVHHVAGRRPPRCGDQSLCDRPVDGVEVRCRLVDGVE